MENVFDSSGQWSAVTNQAWLFPCSDMVTRLWHSPITPPSLPCLMVGEENISVLSVRKYLGSAGVSCGNYCYYTMIDAMIYKLGSLLPSSELLMLDTNILRSIMKTATTILLSQETPIILQSSSNLTTQHQL